MKIKTIDLNFKEWFDKINGNSYLAGNVIINYATEEEEILTCKFQYGYGSQYEQSALEILQENGYINKSFTALWQYCKDFNVILRKSMHRNCLKRELKEF